MDFIIDTIGTTDNPPIIESNKTVGKERNEVIQKLLDKYKDFLEPSTSTLTPPPMKVEKKKSNVAIFCDEMGWNGKIHKKLDKPVNKPDITEILKKSVVIASDFEKLKVVPPVEISKKKFKAQRKKEREKTKGKKWFHMPATEMTEEIKTDLEILKMRSVLDPKHFYKKNDMDALPKYFQVGKVLDSPLEHYNNRLTKKQRKRTLIDELMADAEFTKYNKRKYKEIIQEKQKTHYKAYRQAKKLKRKNKK